MLTSQEKYKIIRIRLAAWIIAFHEQKRSYEAILSNVSFDSSGSNDHNNHAMPDMCQHTQVQHLPE